MNKNCDIVIISDKAYNAIIREAFAKHPVETGGILLGYILDNGVWVVMEMIPPGINGIFQTAYFEYDQDFVNYLGTSVANQYEEPLQVLGLWHRHPGSMDYFSSTDDGTNMDFASRNPYGVVSGLVNIDPKFRLTMYHLNHIQSRGAQNIAYSVVEVEVGDDLIPERLFKLRYIDGAKTDLNPIPTGQYQAVFRDIPKTMRNEDEKKVAYTRHSARATRKVDSNFRRFVLRGQWLLSVILLLIGIGVGYSLRGTEKTLSQLKKERHEHTAVAGEKAEKRLPNESRTSKGDSSFCSAKSVLDGDTDINFNIDADNDININIDDSDNDINLDDTDTI